MDTDRCPGLESEKPGPRCSTLTRRRDAKTSARISSMTRRSKLIHDLTEVVWGKQRDMTLNSMVWPSRQETSCIDTISQHLWYLSKCKLGVTLLRPE